MTDDHQALHRVATRMLGPHHLCCNRTAVTTDFKVIHPLGGWRDLLGPPLRMQQKRGALVPGGHVYQFGVGSGTSIRTLDQIIQCALKDEASCPALLGSMIPNWQATPLTWFAFDSFDGLPPNDGLPLGNVSSSPEMNEWSVGAYAFDPRDSLRRQFGSAMHPVAGFFSDSLLDELPSELRMRPATYVDIDVDLYGSSKLVLDFMLRHRLVVTGTLIGYDDVWVLPCVGGGESMSPLQVGEGRAHAEAAAKYDVEFECVAGPCAVSSGGRRAHHVDLHRYQGSSGGMIFAVRSIGKGRATHGFSMTPAQVDEWKREWPWCARTRSWRKLRAKRSTQTRAKWQQTKSGPRGSGHVDGYCGPTAEGSACTAIDEGSWALSKTETSSWDAAREACEARCKSCAPCRFVSFSVKHRDCSWFARCPSVSGRVAGFSTLRVRRARQQVA